MTKIPRSNPASERACAIIGSPGCRQTPSPGKGRTGGASAPWARVGWAPGGMRSGPVEGWGQCWGWGGPAVSCSCMGNGNCCWAPLAEAGGKAAGGRLGCSLRPQGSVCEWVRAGAVSHAWKELFPFSMPHPRPISHHRTTGNWGRGAGSNRIHFLCLSLNQIYFSGTDDLQFGAFSRQGGGVLITTAVWQTTPRQWHRAAVLLSSDSVGQELRQGTVGTACLCSIISGASAGKLDRWGWNYLEAVGAGCRLSQLELLGRIPRWDLSIWSGLPPSMAASGQSVSPHGSSGLQKQMVPQKRQTPHHLFWCTIGGHVTFFWLQVSRKPTQVQGERQWHHLSMGGVSKTLWPRHKTRTRGSY